jgi:transcription initiation factor TFIID subunit 11
MIVIFHTTYTPREALVVVATPSSRPPRPRRARKRRVVPGLMERAKRRREPQEAVDDVDDLLRDDEEDAEVQRLLEQRRRKKSAQTGELYEQFVRTATSEQLDRFEHWKRSKFPRAAMRRLQADIMGSSTENGAILLATVAKMFAGELIESAREQMMVAGESGPVQPGHLRQAHRRVLRSAGGDAPLFWRSDCGS